MQQTKWHHVSGCQTSVAPAISSHSDGRLYVVAVRTDGEVAFTSIDRAGDDLANTSWEFVNATSLPRLAAASSTPPTLCRDGDGRLYLFCRDVGDNLYTSDRRLTADWTPWRQLTTDNSVRGRISVTFTEDPWTAHVLYEGPSQTARYLRFGNGWSRDASMTWTNIQQAQIGSDGTGEVVVALHTTADRLSLVRQEYPWTATWQPVINEYGGEFDQSCFALSNIVNFTDEFHLLYATSAPLDDMGGSLTYMLAHARVQTHRYDDDYFRKVYDYTPVQERHPQPAIAVYREKLVAAFADEHTNVRAAWLDSADPDTPWVGGAIVAAGMTRNTPSLAHLDSWGRIAPLDKLQTNFGNDLFAVISGLSGDSVWFANFSRAFFVDHLAAIAHRTDWCCNYPAAGCVKCSTPETTEVPEYTEIGYGSMTVPFRIMRELFPRVMAHVKVPNDPYMGWIHAKLLPRRSAYIGPHINVDYAMGHTSWQHEMLHRLATSMALWDNDNPLDHPNPNLMTDFFPDYLVAAATDLFREETNEDWTCGLGQVGVGRCRGFVHGGRADVGSCQHSFIEFVQRYIGQPELLRRLVVEDLRAGVDLLRRKYRWVREFVFFGTEFGGNGVPIHPVHIVNTNSKKALDVTSWSLANNGGLQQYELHRGENQRWLLVPRDHGYFQILSMHSGLALDVAGISHDDGAEVQQYQPHNGHNQQWQLVLDTAGSYEIVARHSDKCLEVAGSSFGDGGAITQSKRDGGDNQKWMLESARP